MNAYQTAALALQDALAAEIAQMQPAAIIAARDEARVAKATAEATADRTDTAEAWDALGLARVRVQLLEDAGEALRPVASERERFVTGWLMNGTRGNR